MRKETQLGWTALFATTGTLVCCALPIALVTLGMGATVVAMTSAFPFLIVLSQHKMWVFIFSGLLLALSAWLIYRPDRLCPTDPDLAVACNRTQLWNRRIFWGSVSIWSIGFIAAFVALPVRIALGL